MKQRPIKVYLIHYGVVTYINSNKGLTALLHKTSFSLPGGTSEFIIFSEKPFRESESMKRNFNVTLVNVNDNEVIITKTIHYDKFNNIYEETPNFKAIMM